MPISIALSAFDIAALIATIGLLACRFAILPPTGDHPILRASTRGVGVALGLLTLSSFGILVSRTLEMNGGVWAQLGPDFSPVIFVTHFGQIWRWRVPALVVAWLTWLWVLRHPRQTWIGGLTALAVAVIAITRSQTGHPGDHGNFTLRVWVDFAHMLAAGAWVGSLFGMSLVVFPALRARGDPLPASAVIFRRLSAWCGGALVILLVGGILNVFWELGGVRNLWTSRFGVILDIKLAIVGTMILMGAHNRYAKLPRLLQAAGLPPVRHILNLSRSGRSEVPEHESGVVRRCARAVLLESVLGLAVLGVTGVLIHAMPPADMPAMHAFQPTAPSAHANHPSM